MYSIRKLKKRPFKYLDYLYIAFAHLDNSNSDSPRIFYRQELEERVNVIKDEARRQNPKVKIFGQFNWVKYLNPLVKDKDKAKADARIDAFAKSIPPFLEKYGFSGIDFDWEFGEEPVVITEEYASDLLTKTKTYIGEKKLSISADTRVSLNPSVVNQNVDIVNVQAYNRLQLIDEFITWETKKEEKGETENEEKGIKREKIYVGICSERAEYYPDDIQACLDCVTDKGLAGLYAWRIDNDDTVPSFAITKAMWKFSRGELVL
jgi:hypothetical protein